MNSYECSVVPKELLLLIYCPEPSWSLSKLSLQESDRLMFVCPRADTMGLAAWCVKGEIFQANIRRQQLQEVFHLPEALVCHPWLILLLLNWNTGTPADTSAFSIGQTGLFSPLAFNYSTYFVFLLTNLGFACCSLGSLLPPVSYDLPPTTPLYI